MYVLEAFAIRSRHDSMPNTAAHCCSFDAQPGSIQANPTWSTNGPFSTGTDYNESVNQLSCTAVPNMHLLQCRL